MKKIFFYFLLASSILFSDSIKNDINVTKFEMDKIKLAEEDLRKEKIANYILELKEIEKKISKKDSVWIKSYASYLTSLDVRESLEKIKERIEALQKKRKKSLSEIDELSALISREKILTSQIEKLKKKDSYPFSDLLTPPNIEEIPSINNPFDIFAGISRIKTLDKDFNDYVLRKKELKELISLLRSEYRIYTQIVAIDEENNYKESAEFKSKQLERFESALDTMNVTADVYQKRLDIVEASINKDVESQVFKLAKIGVIILVVLIFFFLLKLFVKKYITDNERFYMANKIITFGNFTLIILILFFNYIENVSYLVTILGFASAGIAIAMKDWFMSILGWLVIVFGGSIHVGDRIRVDMDGMKYVGDVMDISLLRMTILEDVTLTTVIDNRRAGRIIFIPNNYVFTRMIANYTHSTLKTVWDGVKITITFDSNHKKAIHLAKEITKKFSKGYTDITRKQLNKLRNQYSLKNTNVEPRIFSFIEPNGITIDAWYLTNAYATLTLRSVISSEIVDAFNAEDDITIAYPTQMLHLEKPAKKTPPFKIDEKTV
ncbi:mechanosensitive ion channel family protein [Sulfurimonas sp. CVO]|jgi:small-conductance mechanosensitive channel|uniref:Mechanosensitive ion channel n=1 Tax=Sulfurimonas xiamenensis TaxID=2590021 RepID=A0AAJ4DMP6_9BACT|nr:MULTISPECIES: mechanosensitive ion channel domain-containing protein [Sulfurimonas]QFR43388.1 mechanosensitive ion channel [Sulfurimonas xiamenensis]QHG91044.1 mechanosensitive ion channel family protein [Sulfurimonas sp. CVO]